MKTIIDAGVGSRTEPATGGIGSVGETPWIRLVPPTIHGPAFTSAQLDMRDPATGSRQ
jgi:hypothetical protein